MLTPSVIIRSDSRYERLPQDVRSRLSDRFRMVSTPVNVADPELPQRQQPPQSPQPQNRSTATFTRPTPQRDVAVILQNVSKTYVNGNPVLTDVTFQMHKGDFLFVTGASGAGKSTLLRLLYGQERPSAGDVIVGGTSLNHLRGNQLAMVRRRIGIVFQDYKLIPRRTVAENVAFVLWAQGYSRKEIHRRLWPTLKMVGLQGKADNFPDQLSGGEQQRVSIARAIVGTPPLLLADEPTGNLDPDNALQVIKILKKLNSIGITVLVTTHNEHLVRLSNQPVVQLNNGRLHQLRR